MKRFFVVIALLITTFSIQAVPIYYTFEGTVDSIYDTTGAALDAGYEVGSVVTYTMLVDTEGTGTQSYTDGTMDTFVDGPSGTGTTSGFNDYFYTDYISGSAMDITFDSILETNMGLTRTLDSTGSTYSALYGGSYIKVSGTGAEGAVDDWLLGQTFTGLNRFGEIDAGILASYITSTLTLTEIRPAEIAVPEPASLALMAFGLIGLGITKRRR